MKLTERHSPLQAASLIKQLSNRGLDPKATLQAWDIATTREEIADGEEIVLRVYAQTHNRSERVSYISIGAHPFASCDFHLPQKACHYHANSTPGSIVNSALLHIIDEGWKPATASEMLTDDPY